MKLRDEDRRWLAEEISKQVKKAVADAIDKFRPHGWRRVTFWLREWGIAGAIITAFIALIAIAATAFYQATARVAKEATFETNTERDINDIKKELQALHGDVAKQSLINHAALPLQVFKATLPELDTAITTAKQQSVRVPASVLEGLQQKLQQSTDVPELWPTAGGFITYRSVSISPALQSNLPDCTDQDPSDSKVVKVEGDQFTFTHRSYENCRLTLDSPKDDDRINWLVTHTAMVLDFKHCLIVYRGGEVKLITAAENAHLDLSDRTRPNLPKIHIAFTGQTLYFENCIFDFSLRSTPPMEGHKDSGEPVGPERFVLESKD